MLNPNLYEVTREADRWMCRPSVLFVRVGFAMGAGMSAFMVYMAWLFLREGHQDENKWAGAVILLMAVVVAGFAVWRWRTGHTPLTVERSGRVCYGDKELCSAGEVRAIWLVPAPGGEDAYDVWLELEGGTRKVLPGFVYGSRENALAFAQEVAAELRVTVDEVAS